jgi:O-antigen/teichoic acid export membrane protein
MARTGQLIRGVFSNWVSLGLSVVVAFFLSPYLVHHLGDVGYGVWVLINSIIGYMGLLDLGLRGAVMRFVSREHTKGQHDEASRTVSAAFWLRVWIGLLIISIAVVLSFLIGRFFNIPPTLLMAARIAIITTGTSAALNLTFGVFAGVLSALHRFDLMSGVMIVQTLLRAAGVVYLLKTGHGIVGLAIWEFVTVALACAAYGILCFKLYPQLQLFFRRPDREILGRLWGYSSYVFLIHICLQLVYYTDNLIVGAFLSAASVTFYAIGGRLIEYVRQVVTSLTTTFTPLASTLEASGEKTQLQRLLIEGTRAALLLVLPMAVALMLRGPTFIGLWMGPQYAEISGRVMQILIVGQVFIVANNTSSGIAFGLEKHKTFALWFTAEAVANLVLSVLLVRRMGIMGVAWGTTITTLATQIIFWPPYICRVLEMPVSRYVWQSWTKPALATVPYAIACYFADQHWHANNMAEFFVQIFAILPIFVVSAGLWFWRDIRALLELRRATPVSTSAAAGS